MTEIYPNTTEQVVVPPEQMLSTDVFEGVYGSFADVAKAKRQRKEYNNGQILTLEVDPAIEFAQNHFTAAQEKIAPLDNQQVRASEVQDRFIDEAKTTALTDYAGRPAAIATRFVRANRIVGGFINRANEMVKAGETDGLSVKTFFGSIDSLKHGLSLGYNDLVRKSDEPLADEKAKDVYNNTIHGIFGSKPNVEEQHNGGFIHVNGERYLQSGEKTSNRFYISPKINAQPGEVVKLWADTLEELGLGEKIYYKVATHLAHRYDTLVAYVSPETTEDGERAIETFMSKCPPELLSDTNMPSAITVGKGVSRAPEPEQLNTLLRYRGKDTVSYNEFVAGLTELALRRASYDFVKLGVQPNQVTPKAVAAAGKVYFGQFIKLAGLDPVQMQTAVQID